MNVVVSCSAGDVDVATTVTVVVLGGGSELNILWLQPVTRPSPTTLTANRSSICRLRRFLMPNRQSATASVANGKSGLESR